MNDEHDDLYGDDEVPAAAGPAPKPAGKMENVMALGRNPSTARVVIATGAAIAVVGAITIFGIVSRSHHRESQLPPALSGASVGAPGSLQDDSRSPLANSDQYQKMVAEANARRASEALASGDSVQPLATTLESSLKPAATPAEIAASAAVAEKERHEAELAAAAAQRATQATGSNALQQPQASQAPQQPDPGDQQMMENARKAMAALIAPREMKTMVVSMGDQINATGTGAGPATAQPASTVPGANSVAAAPAQVTLIGAGQIEAARLDTGINTDVSSEFGATLLTGPYKGAKLIGAVQRRGDKALLTVHMLSMPGRGVSVPATAVILDAETDEAGTATDVDRKLLVKYGIKPLAAGFAAVADYLKQAGTTVIVNGDTVTQTQPELTNKRVAQIVGGSAAEQINNDANALDTTPTVRVARSTVVGVFFTQDVLYTPRR